MTELFAPFVLLREDLDLDLLGDRGPPAEAAWSEGRTWVELLYSGTFHHYVARSAKGRSARSITFTEDDLRSMGTTFAKAQAEGYWPGGGPKVDVNHALALGSNDVEETRARARIVELRTVRRDDGALSLEGLFEWTAAGVDLVRSGAFVGISSELVHPDYALSKTTAEPLGGWLVEGATFCNDPMVHGLREPETPKQGGSALRSRRKVVLLSAASEGTCPAHEVSPMPGMLLTCAALALSADASDAEVSRAVDLLKTERDDALAGKDGADARLAASIVIVGEVTEDRDTIKASLATVRASQRTELVARFVEQGRIVPAKSDSLLRVLDAELRSGSWDEAVTFCEGVFDADRTAALGKLRGNLGLDSEQITIGSISQEVEVEVLRLAKAEGQPRATIELRTRAEDTVLARPGRMDAYLAADSNPNAAQA